MATVVALWLRPDLARGFCPPTSAHTHIVQAITQTQLQSSETSPETAPTLPASAVVGRRDLLAGSVGSALLAAAAAGSGWQPWQQLRVESSSYDYVTGASQRQPLFMASSLDEALALIDAQCDRRFLHAVVSSDYRLLYRGVPVSSPASQVPSVYQVDDERRRHTAPVAAEFRTALEWQQEHHQTSHSSSRSSTLLSTWSSSSPFHVAATDPQSISSTNPNQSVVSVWPLGDNVHFAWSKDPQAARLVSSSSHGQQAMIANKETTNSLIVDGVDCGVMSLEDALERPHGQVLVHANSVLMVPATMERELVERLKQSFLI